MLGVVWSIYNYWEGNNKKNEEKKYKKVILFRKMMMWIPQFTNTTFTTLYLSISYFTNYTLKLVSYTSLSIFRVLCQGSLLSPYLFVLCMGRWHMGLRMQERVGDWSAYQLCKNRPFCTDLFFADDLLLFG